MGNKLLGIRGVIWSLQDMHEIEAHLLIAPMTNIASFIQALKSMLANLRAQNTTSVQINPEQFNDLFAALGQIRQNAEILKMGLTSSRVTDCYDFLSNSFVKGVMRYEEIDRCKNSLEGLLRLIIDELNSYKFLSISPTNAELYSAPLAKFDQSVIDRFPSSQFELEEAGKCFALGRYTACIFHLMRGMEDAVARLADEIGATVVNANGETLGWGILTANIKAKIDGMGKGRKQDNWYEVHAMLHSVNRAFRTKTAHPEKVYTEEQAGAAMASVSAFMSNMTDVTKASVLKFGQKPS